MKLLGRALPHRVAVRQGKKRSPGGLRIAAESRRGKATN